MTIFLRDNFLACRQVAVTKFSSCGRVKPVRKHTDNSEFCHFIERCLMRGGWPIYMTEASVVLAILLDMRSVAQSGNGGRGEID